MTTFTKRCIVGLSWFSLVAFVAYYVINNSLNGYLDYMVWRSLNGDAGKGAYTQIGESTIYYEIHGSGEPLLLLHGGFGSIDNFYQQIPLMAQSYRVIAIDSRGHGHSTDTAQPLSYVSMSDDTAELLRQLGIQNTRVLGWSDGGVVGLDLAMRNPGLISKLAIFGSNFHYEGVIPDELIDSAYPADGELLNFPRIAYQMNSPHPEKWPDFVKKLLTMWTTQPTYTIEQVGDITAETLVMVGADDMVKLSHTKMLVEAIDNATLVIIPNANHFALVENPAEVNPRLMAFFAD